MAEGLGASFKCCSMCSQFCFETHGDFGSMEVQVLLSAPSFFSVIKRSHIEGSKFLRIPVLFYERCKNNVGRALDLIGPWGFKCRVTAERHHQGYVLRTGFKPFLAHHRVDAGDSLVFYLRGESIFSVKVYDKFGSEKKDPVDASEEDPVGGSDSEGSGEKAVDRFLKLQEERLSRKKVKARSRKKAKDLLRSESFTQPAAGLHYSHLHGDDDDDLEEEITPARSSGPAPPGDNVVLEARPKEDGPAELPPAFLKTMTDLSITSALQLPASFVTSCGTRIGAAITLQGPGNKKWEVLVRVEKEKNSMELGNGWQKFVVDHVVQIGDQLTFTLTAESHFQVVVFDESGSQKNRAMDGINLPGLMPQKAAEAVQVGPSVPYCNKPSVRPKQKARRRIRTDVPAQVAKPDAAAAGTSQMLLG